MAAEKERVAAQVDVIPRRPERRWRDFIVELTTGASKFSGRGLQIQLDSRSILQQPRQGESTQDHLKAAIRRATISLKFAQVLMGSVLADTSVQLMLDAV